MTSEEITQSLAIFRAIGAAKTKPAAIANERTAIPRRDETAYRKARALAVLNSLEDLPGMSAWLQRERPDIWERCVHLLHEVDSVWDGSMLDFEEQLWAFEVAFREARELYRPHLQKATQGVLEGLQAADGKRARQ